jgi:hypothetical protein
MLKIKHLNYYLIAVLLGVMSSAWLIPTFVVLQQTNLDSVPNLQSVMGTVFRSASQMQTVLETPNAASVAVSLPV